jgi:aminoglycoside/choline kinase family phosphotransferase
MMQLQDEIISFARESLGISPSIEVQLLPFSGRGSDRTYFRFIWDRTQSAILVHYDPKRVENTYFANIAFFLQENDIPVPQIISHDATHCLILMKDLGDTDLWSLRNEPWEVRKMHYQKTLAIAHKLHSFSDQLLSSSRVRMMEAFGPALYRWERDYFRDNFVNVLCGIEMEPGFGHQLEIELAGLAEKLASHRRCLVHRDLQSQNVMAYREEPFLIDFQGMRFGTSFYDLSSLLCDPYVNFSDAERKELLFYYYGLSKQDLDWSRFQFAFWEASAQRLMQALGCYGFLSLTKGLKNYLSYVPAGLRNLRISVENAVSLPRLLEICAECEKALAS